MVSNQFKLVSTGLCPTRLVKTGLDWNWLAWTAAECLYFVSSRLVWFSKIILKTGVSQTTSTGRNFGVDFESMGQITWKLFKKKTANVFIKKTLFFILGS